MSMGLKANYTTLKASLKIKKKDKRIHSDDSTGQNNDDIPSKIYQELE